MHTVVSWSQIWGASGRC